MNAASLLATLGVSRQPAGAAAGGPGPGPAARKMATTGGDSRLAFAVCATQGWRKAMEDYATATLNLPLPPPLAADPARRVDYFAVFDGHGGAHVARFASRFLHKHIVGHDAFAAGDVTNAIRWGFFNTDNAARLDDLAGSETCGSTACVALVTADARLWVGNAGDCRAVLATRGRPARALSRDHKPDVPQESARIRRAGGDVFENRVMGELAVSRSLGDFRFKKNPKLGLDEQLVSSEPEVTVTQLSADDEFLFLACDGIWDVVGNQEVVDFVRQRLSAGLGAGEICEQLVERCLPAAPTEDARGMDNMTV
ncbi:phosphatase 2C-like domain-containing protein, partial [Hyaloraphidium curvatum]